MAQKVLIPEVVEPDSTLPRDLLALKKFAILLDAAIAIPGTRRRIGLDPIIGLVPGVGDAVGAILSSWIVIGAVRHRVPGAKLGRMIVNILIDVLVGAIPVLGDVVDFLWPENLKNVDLLIRYRDRHRPPRSVASVGLAVAVILGVLALAGLAAIGIVIFLLYLLLRDFPLL